MCEAPSKGWASFTLFQAEIAAIVIPAFFRSQNSSQRYTGIEGCGTSAQTVAPWRDMVQELDLTTASELISELDNHFASLRRYLMPPYQPTGRNTWHERRQILDAEGFQKIADEMRLYLGLSHNVRVRLLTKMFDHATTGTGLGGMQWSEEPWNSDVVLSCRPHMQTINLAAALAHEMTHAFFEYKGFRGETEERNELLTEAGAIYLGMGNLLWEGYGPITWQEQTQSGVPGAFSNTITTYTASIGYIDTSSVNLLMDLSSQSSGCQYGYMRNYTVPSASIVRKNVPQLFRHWTEQRAASREDEKKRLAQTVDKLEQLYAKLDNTFSSPSFLAGISRLVGPEWSSLGDIYAAYASGKLRMDVNGISARMEFLKTNARWNAREARNIEADAAEKSEMIQKVMEQLGK